MENLVKLIKVGAFTEGGVGSDSTKKKNNCIWEVVKVIQSVLSVQI